MRSTRGASGQRTASAEVGGIGNSCLRPGRVCGYLFACVVVFVGGLGFLKKKVKQHTFESLGPRSTGSSIAISAGGTDVQPNPALEEPFR